MTEKTKAPSLRALATKYGTSHRAIADLKKLGVDVLDPEQVAIKLVEQNPKWEMPDGMLGKKKATPLKKKSKKGNTDPGLRAAIDRLRAAELEAHDKFQSAINPVEEQRYLKVWHTTLEQLRKVEESQPDIESANSQSISKEDLAQTLGTLFRNLRQDLDTLPQRIALIGQNTSEDALASIVKVETDRIIDSLYACRLLNEKG
jgi:hypothetical protein